MSNNARNVTPNYLMTPSEAAAALGRCERTVARWIQRGRLRGYTRAGGAFVDRRDVERELRPRPISARGAR